MGHGLQAICSYTSNSKLIYPLGEIDIYTFFGCVVYIHYIGGAKHVFSLLELLDIGYRARVTWLWASYSTKIELLGFQRLTVGHWKKVVFL